MIYEIIAVIYILFTLVIFLCNMEKTAHELGYKARNLKKLMKEDKDEGLELVIPILLILALGIFSWIFTISIMFWTASKGIMIAKYYAFGFIGYILIFTIVPSIFRKKKKKIKKQVPLKAKIFRYVTAFLEIGIIIYALWIIV
jgi:hypothetical protein